MASCQFKKHAENSPLLVWEMNRQKVDIGSEEVDIQDKKVDIGSMLSKNGLVILHLVEKKQLGKTKNCHQKKRLLKRARNSAKSIQINEPDAKKTPYHQ